jgi:hypothetical protein
MAPQIAVGNLNKKESPVERQSELIATPFGNLTTRDQRMGTNARSQTS